MINTLQAIPTVVIGFVDVHDALLCFGPPVIAQLLFTQKAMILGQMLICFPISGCYTGGALQASDRRAVETARTLESLPLESRVL